MSSLSIHSLNIFLFLSYYVSCASALAMEVCSREVSRATRSVSWAYEGVTNLHLNLRHAVERGDGQHGKGGTHDSGRTTGGRSI